MKKKLVFILMVAVIYSVLALVIFPLSYAGFYVLFLIDKLIGGPLFCLFLFGLPFLGVVMIATGNFGIGCMIGWGLYALESKGLISLKTKIVKKLIWLAVLLLVAVIGGNVYRYFAGLNTLTKLMNSTAGGIVPAKIVLKDQSCKVVITSQEVCRFFAKFMSKQDPKYFGQDRLYQRLLTDAEIVWPDHTSWTAGTLQITPDSIGVVPTQFDGDDFVEKTNALPINAIDPVYDAVIWFLSGHRESGELCLEISDQNYPQGITLLNAVLADNKEYISKTSLKTQMIWSETLVLQIALARKNWDMVKLLLDQGCSVDGGIPLAFTNKDTPEEITSVILGRTSDFSYLKYDTVFRAYSSWRDFFIQRWQVSTQKSESTETLLKLIDKTNNI